MMPPRPVVFSGIQPSGDLHLGNYIGAIRNWVAAQSQADNIFCIVDLHALTVYQDPAVLRRTTRETAGLLLACGIDPAQCLLFLQSQVTAHAELAWILNCLTPVGWLERMTQYKVKAVQQASVSTGLLDYPVLMAADILLYQTQQVPVGEDQRQHLELTRDVASRFNHLYGETFVLPEGRIPSVGARIMGLDDPTVKMSKSTQRPYHAVGLLDDAETIRASFQRAVTDSGREIVFSNDPAKAGVNNLLTIYQALSHQGREEIERHFAGKGYGELKREAANLVIATLRPMQQRYFALMDDAEALDALLQHGADTARERAEITLRTVKERVGLFSPHIGNFPKIDHRTA
jgi:tryptophanyl-tRNA synthetase